MRVKCLAQEHNTMSPARARTRTVRSGVVRTNHEATAPPFLVDIHKMARNRKVLWKLYARTEKKQLLMSQLIYGFCFLEFP